MSTRAKSLNEITQDAIELLTREMGVAATLRFLSQFTTGYGNYTEERDALVEGLTLDDIVKKMKGMAGRKAPQTR